MPINFPVEPGKGWSFPGMMTPAVDSAYGLPTFYTSDPKPEHLGEEKVIALTVVRGVARSTILGPENAFKDPEEGHAHAERSRAPVDFYVDEEAGAVAIIVEGAPPLVMEAGGLEPTLFRCLFRCCPLACRIWRESCAFMCAALPPSLRSMLRR